MRERKINNVNEVKNDMEILASKTAKVLKAWNSAFGSTMATDNRK